MKKPKISVYDTHKFERSILEKQFKAAGFDCVFHETRLTEATANLAANSNCVCVFVNDVLNSKVLEILKAHGIELLALRSAGFNHVDLNTAQKLGMTVVNVPEYSPYAVAEHALALIMTLNRKTHKAYNRTREGNFSLDGLVGFDLHKKTVGLIGLGRIGNAMAHILSGFRCNILGYDLVQSPDLVKLGVKFVDLETLLKESDIVSLHIPLNASTKHIINSQTLSLTKKGVMLINTSRGALVETKALIKALKMGHLSGAGLDVYEEEAGVFFENHSEEVLQDDVLSRLLTFPNTIVTSHQGFLTQEALLNIAETTTKNILEYSQGKTLSNSVKIN